jgi:hypothetical protein
VERGAFGRCRDHLARLWATPINKGRQRLPMLHAAHRIDSYPHTTPNKMHAEAVNTCAFLAKLPKPDPQTPQIEDFEKLADKAFLDGFWVF